MGKATMRMFGIFVTAVQIGTTGCSRLPVPVRDEKPVMRDTTSPGTDLVTLASKAETASLASEAGAWTGGPEDEADQAGAGEDEIRDAAVEAAPLDSEAGADPQAGETGISSLTTEVNAELSPRSQPRVWLEARSKELEGTRRAMLKVSVTEPVTFINVMIRFDPERASILWKELIGHDGQQGREVESSTGWRQYHFEFSKPVQGELTLAELGYEAHGSARETAVPPFDTSVTAALVERR